MFLRDIPKGSFFEAQSTQLLGFWPGNTWLISLDKDNDDDATRDEEISDIVKDSPIL